MSAKVPSQAQFWGIREPELNVLFLITLWFNGKEFNIRGERRRISTHHDPPLEELFHGSKGDYEQYEYAHERLLNNGLLQEEYVCRRKIDWGPTQQGLQAIRDVLEPWSDELRPRWADENDDGPLFGDPNEGVTHRKGVEIAGRLFPRMAWAFDITRPGHPSYGVDWYPTDGRGEACHDLHVDTQPRATDVGVEVVTDNNNTDRLVAKWKRLQSEDRLTFWIFDRRETACQLWNALDQRGEFHLDGQFREYGNWSAQAINRKLWRSSNTYREEPAEDIVQTVTGLLEGGHDTIQELYSEYYSTN